MSSADRPTTGGNRQYHLQTADGEIAPRCLLVGSPERAQLIADSLMSDAKLMGDHRGLKTFTGTFLGHRVSVVTTGMGSASTAIVLPEAMRSGGRIFIRVGSCSTLWERANIGEAAIASAAVRFDGASDNWAPIEYPAVADWRVVAALVDAGKRKGHPCHVGIGATTTCFNEGQGRPPDRGELSPRMRERHQEMLRLGVLFYSMEEATLFTWGSTHGGFPCGAIDAIYGNRITNQLEVRGDVEACEIGLHALTLLDPAEVVPAELQ